jgi:predicted glycoside hydrolase/deacetylase ChbG (UPF0249 family)
VIHVDDVGVCHGSNTAFVELRRAGHVSSGSVMVPCPWSSEALALAAAEPRLDVGVHLTLTSEHRHYRWGPVSAGGRVGGLVDDSGSMWRKVAHVRENADPDAVVDEWRSQIDMAIDAGVDVTHLDTHMGSAFAPEWSEHYVALGVDYGIPVLMTRTIGGYGVARHLPDVTEAEHRRAVDCAVEAGMPIADLVIETDFTRPVGAPLDLVAVLRGAVDSGKELVFLALHPCHPGEIESIDPGRSHVRTDEVTALMHPSWSSTLAELGTSGLVEVVGMADLRATFSAGL